MKRNTPLKLYLLISTVLSTAVCAAPITETEANDTFTNGQVISASDFTVASNADLHDDSLPTVSISGEIATDNDVDFYCFTVDSGVSLYLDIDYGADQGTSVDTMLTLFDPTEALVALGDDATTSVVGGGGSTDTLDAFIGTYVTPVAGQYCVAVTSFANFPSAISGGTTSTPLDLSGDSYQGVTPGDSSFPNGGGSSGDYVLQISASKIRAAIQTKVQKIPTTGIWALLVLMMTVVATAYVLRKQQH